MARGFESKDVEFQQAEAQRDTRTPVVRGPAERVAESDRRTIELSLTRVRSELAQAAHPAHRQMLERAIGDLERQLAAATDRR